MQQAASRVLLFAYSSTLKMEAVHPPKCQHISTGIYVITSKKVGLFIVTVVRTSNLTNVTVKVLRQPWLLNTDHLIIIDFTVHFSVLIIVFQKSATVSKEYEDV
jgi:hypothetical protein